MTNGLSNGTENTQANDTANTDKELNSNSLIASGIDAIGDSVISARGVRSTAP